MFVPKGRARASVIGAKHVDELEQAKLARAMHARRSSCVPPTTEPTTHTAQLAHWPACCTARPLTCREMLPELQATAEEQTIARKELGGMSFARGGLSFARGARRKPSLGGAAPAGEPGGRPGGELEGG